jgi:hypothetical protein
MARGLIELLRANVTEVNKNVQYLGEGVLVSAQLPRVTVSSALIGERPWLGEKIGASNRGAYKRFSVHVDVWSKNAAQSENIAAKVESTIWKNRGYHPVDSSTGYFVNMLLTGGASTHNDSPTQIFLYSLEVDVTWMDLESYS